MHITRRPLHLTTALLLGALGAGLLATSTASADSVLIADRTAQNVTAYGVTSAWSRRVADGDHRLVIRGASGIAEDAAVASSAVPFHPDLGPTKGNGRAVVYTRCTNVRQQRGCDIYVYDIGSGKETKVTRASSPTDDEVGPSYYKGTIAFGRYGSRGGLYLARPGRGVKRIPGFDIVDETDLSATRVIGRMDLGAITKIRVAMPGGERGRTIGLARRTDYGGTEVLSPVLAFYRAFWLKRDTDKRLSVVETVSLRSSKRVPQEVDRAFADPDVSAIALGSGSVPTLYSGVMGISMIDPRLVYTG